MMEKLINNAYSFKLKNVTKLEDGSYSVPLTDGLSAIISECDIELVSQHNWCAVKHGQTHYAQTTIRGSRKKVYLHRMILNPGNFAVDHVSGDGLDNRRENLRLANQLENSRNKKKKKNCTSIYKGVHWHGQRQKWQARINFNDKTESLGLFTEEIEAARAYDRAAIEKFGEFARTNFPIIP